MGNSQQVEIAGGHLRAALTLQRVVALSTATTTLIALAATVGIVAVVIVLNGADPGTAFRVIVQGSLGNTFVLGQTIMITSILALTGLAAAIPFAAHVWNAGAEGQMYFGAFAAAGISLTIDPGLPHWVFAPIVVLGSMVAGALWGLIPGILKATIDANEIIVTLMLSFVAINLATYGIRALWPQGVAPQTRSVPGNATLPDIWPHALVNVGAILALVAVFIAWILISRTRLGFEIRSVGFNPRASRMNGMRIGWVTSASFAIGGAFAGLAGGIIVNGINGALISGFSANYGFIGIAVALLARINPAWIIPSALLFGILRVGSNSFQAGAGLDPSIGDVLVATFIILLLFFRIIRLSYAQPT